MNQAFSCLVGLVSLVLAAGCSSSSSGPETSDGGGSDAGAGSDTGASGTDTGTIPGLTVVTCYKPASKRCDLKGESTPAGVESVKASCTSAGRSVVDHCPSEGLQGCCLASGVGQCTYDAAIASTLQGACASSGGKWTTTAP